MRVAFNRRLAMIAAKACASLIFPTDLCALRVVKNTFGESIKTLREHGGTSSHMAYTPVSLRVMIVSRPFIVLVVDSRVEVFATTSLMMPWGESGCVHRLLGRVHLPDL